MRQRTPAGHAGWYRAGIGLAVVALAVSACGSSKKTSPVTSNGPAFNKNTVNSGTTVKGGSIVYDVEKKTNFYNTLDGNGNTDVAGVIYNGILESPYIAEPDYSLKLNTDLVTSAQQTSTSPETIVYTINPSAVWNDGTPVNAEDFIYAWITEAGVDQNITAASTSGYQNIQSVVGSGTNNQTVTVTFKNDQADSFPDWKSLFTLLPAHVAEQHGYNKSMVTPPKSDKGLEDSWTWFGANMPNWSDGPYQYDTANTAADGTKTVLVPNPKWYGKVAPSFTSITFNYVSDASQEPTAMANNEAQVIYPQPQVGLVTTVKGLKSQGINYQISQGLSWEHWDLNLLNSFLGGKTQAEQQDPVKVALRTAMFTAVSRQDIINKTVGLFDPSSKPLGSHMYVPGQTGYTDVVTPTGQGTGDIAKAKALLTAAGYTGVGTKLVTPSGQPVPTFNIRYTQGNAIRQSECQIIESDMAQLGITINVDPTDDLSKSLNQADANHAYDTIIFGWLDTVFPNSGNGPLWITNPSQGGGVVGGNYGYLTDPTVDSLMKDAGTTLDPQKAVQDQDQADAQLTKDAYVLPLYQKDTMLVYNTKIVNIRDNATSAGPTYNVQEWGFKATAS